jgi:hypothetical protein
MTKIDCSRGGLGAWVVAALLLAGCGFGTPAAQPAATEPVPAQPTTTEPTAVEPATVEPATATPAATPETTIVPTDIVPTDIVPTDVQWVVVRARQEAALFDKPTQQSTLAGAVRGGDVITVTGASDDGFWW